MCETIEGEILEKPKPYTRTPINSFFIIRLFIKTIIFAQLDALKGFAFKMKLAYVTSFALFVRSLYTNSIIVAHLPDCDKIKIRPNLRQRRVQYNLRINFTKT